MRDNRKKCSFVHYFSSSLAAGILSELTNYACMLLCGYLLSDLLEAVMQGQLKQGYNTALLTILVLLFSTLPKYAFSIWRSSRKLHDTQHFREFLYQCVLNRSIHVEDCGEMNVRMNRDVNTIAAYFQETCPKAISGMAVLFCSTTLICFVDWRIGSIFFTLNLTQLIPVIIYEKWARQVYNQTHSDEEAYCNWMLEGYHGIRTIKAYGVEQWYMKRYYCLNSAIIKSGKRAEQVSTVETIIFSAIDSLLNYGSYVILGLFLLSGNLNPEDAPLLLILGGYLFSSISSVFELRLQQFDYQEAYKQLGFRKVFPDKPDSEYILRVQNISKSYGEKQVLQEVSCVVYSGDRILLRGENGSGKSTLLRILTGLEKADSGTVSYGIPREEISLSLQEEPKLNITGKKLVHAMIETGCVDTDALENHFQKFQIKELLSKSLSDLSPGERKKFFLSAALAHRGALLLLDEPANHMDAKSIQYLQEQLQIYTGTLIVCTHATDLTLDYNKTILMEGGVCHAS